MEPGGATQQVCRREPPLLGGGSPLGVQRPPTTARPTTTDTPPSCSIPKLDRLYPWRLVWQCQLLAGCAPQAEPMLGTLGHAVWSRPAILHWARGHAQPSCPMPVTLVSQSVHGHKRPARQRADDGTGSRGEQVTRIMGNRCAHMEKLRCCYVPFCRCCCRCCCCCCCLICCNADLRKSFSTLTSLPA